MRHFNSRHQIWTLDFYRLFFHWIPFVWFNPLVGPMSAIAERSLTILVDGRGSSTLRWSGRPFRRVRLEQSVNSFNQQLTADGAEWKCSICRLVYSQVGKLPCIKMLINPLKYSLIFHIIIINIWIWTLSLSLSWCCWNILGGGHQSWNGARQFIFRLITSRRRPAIKISPSNLVVCDTVTATQRPPSWLNPPLWEGVRVGKGGGGGRWRHNTAALTVSFVYLHSLKHPTMNGVFFFILSSLPLWGGWNQLIGYWWRHRAALYRGCDVIVDQNWNWNVPHSRQMLIEWPLVY